MSDPSQEGYEPLPCPNCGWDMLYHFLLLATYEFVLPRPVCRSGDAGPLGPDMVPAGEVTGIVPGRKAAPYRARCSACDATVWTSASFGLPFPVAAPGPGRRAGQGKNPCPHCGKDLDAGGGPLTTFRFLSTAGFDGSATPADLRPEDWPPEVSSPLIDELSASAYPERSACQHCGGTVWDVRESPVRGPYFTDDDLEEWFEEDVG